MKKIWTAWAAHAATGEGMTVMVWIGYATSATEALAGFGGRFDPYFADACEVEEGVVRNEVTAHLLTEPTAEQLARAAGRAKVEFYSKFHLNAA